MSGKDEISVPLFSTFQCVLQEEYWIVVIYRKGSTSEFRSLSS